MKSTKKIIPALAMLLVSAVMMATASFAWFAMSSEATANNMNVQLKSDSKYLLISTSENMANATNSVDGEPADGFDSNSIAPVAHDENLASSDVETVGKWYTMVGTSSSDGTGVVPSGDGAGDGKTHFTEQGALSGYINKYTYYVAMANGSKAGGALTLQGDIRITKQESSAGSTLDPIRVIIVCGNKIIELSTKNKTSNETLLESVPALTDSNSKGTAINVYVYYDGNDTSVKTENIVNLANVTVSFTLQVADSVAGS